MNRALILLFVFSGFQLFSADKDRSKMSTEEFISLARQALIGESWLKMEGKINTRPLKGKRARYPFQLAAVMKSDNLVVKTRLQNDSVKVKYLFGDVHDVKQLEVGSRSLYDSLGLRPGDFSLSFMYWDLMKEYDKENITAALIKCRVFLLADPDKNEYAKVWISEEYLGPIKVMWKKGGVDFNEPDRILEFTGITKKNNRSMPKEAYLKNSFGDMQIRFEKHAGEYGSKIPDNLFKF